MQFLGGMLRVTQEKGVQRKLDMHREQLASIIYGQACRTKSKIVFQFYVSSETMNPNNQR